MTLDGLSKPLSAELTGSDAEHVFVERPVRWSRPPSWPAAPSSSAARVREVCTKPGVVGVTGEWSSDAKAVAAGLRDREAHGFHCLLETLPASGPPVGSIAIPRARIRDLDHPGLGVGITGTVIAAVGLAPFIGGLTGVDSNDQTIRFAAGLTAGGGALLVVSGAVMMGWGYATWLGSRHRAERTSD